MDLSFTKITDIKYDNKLYTISQHSKLQFNCIIISGKNVKGNDYIISNTTIILKTYFNIITDESKLLWLHASGPSPHFILYKNPKVHLKINELETYVKSMCPKKSFVNGMELHSCLLSNVKKTDIIGCVNIVNVKLNKLLSFI